jgi:plasmid stability protein
MASMVIRNIPEDVYDRLQKRAEADGKSAEQLVREAITDKVKPSREEVLRMADEIRARSKPMDRETAQRIFEESRQELHTRHQWLLDR